jgi:hypothetical protein
MGPSGHVVTALTGEHAQKTWSDARNALANGSVYSNGVEWHAR